MNTDTVKPTDEPVTVTGVVSSDLLGSFFFPHRVRGSELIARTVMRSPWPAGPWVETRDESGALVEVSCSPPCWFELLPNVQDQTAEPAIHDEQ